MPKLFRAHTSPAGPILDGQKWSGTNYGQPKVVPLGKFGPPSGPLLDGLIGSAGPVLADPNWSRMTFGWP